jgi:hypothetical protein
MATQAHAKREGQEEPRQVPGTDRVHIEALICFAVK